VGAKWNANGLVIPNGYRLAYQAYEGDWRTIGSPEAFGGQGLPISLATAVLETRGRANIGFALCPC